MGSSFDRGDGHLGSTEAGNGSLALPMIYSSLPWPHCLPGCPWEGPSLGSGLYTAYGAYRALRLDVSAQLEGSKMLEAELHTLGKPFSSSPRGSLLADQLFSLLRGMWGSRAGARLLRDPLIEYLHQ